MKKGDLYKVVKRYGRKCVVGALITYVCPRSPDNSWLPHHAIFKVPWAGWSAKDYGLVRAQLTAKEAKEIGRHLWSMPKKFVKKVKLGRFKKSGVVRANRQIEVYI